MLSHFKFSINPCATALVCLYLRIQTGEFARKLLLRANKENFILGQTTDMSGIKDLTILMHWVDNSKQPTLEASLFKKRKVPRERQLILNDLKEEANRATTTTYSKDDFGRGKEKRIR